jgi:exopolysaccharide biosynthesis polyprenyl glycosylphosphotransferase
MAIALSLIGGYKFPGKMAALSYAAEHVIACLSGFVASSLALFLIATYDSTINSSRAVFIISALGFCALSLAQRRFFWFALGGLHQKRSLLIVADAETGSRFFRAYRAHGQTQGLEFVTVDPSLVGKQVAGDGSPVFQASADDLPRLLEENPEHRHEGIVVVASDENLAPRVLNFLATVHFQNMPVHSIQSFYEAYWEKVPLHLLTPTWPLQAGFHLVKHSAFAAIKRLLDVCISLVALVIFAPLMAVTAVAIRLDSPGPAIFRQSRVGQHRRRFRLFKFRTMTVGSEHKGIYTTANDPRVTRIGKFLRASRLDELPQILNVLKGEMSLIGPRAEWVKCVEQYEDVIPHYHFRHLVRPGITGWAQVNHPYGASLEDTLEKLMYDLYYIRNFSLQLDAAVILKTIHVMISAKGQ